MSRLTARIRRIERRLAKTRLAGAPRLTDLGRLKGEELLRINVLLARSKHDCRDGQPNWSALTSCELMELDRLLEATPNQDSNHG